MYDLFSGQFEREFRILKDVEITECQLRTLTVETGSDALRSLKCVAPSTSQERLLETKTC